MKLMERIAEIEDLLSLLNENLNEESVLYQKRVKVITNKMEECKNQINSVKQQISDLSCIDITLLGPYMARLLTEYENVPYVFHKADVDYEIGHAGYGRYVVEKEQKSIYLISRFDHEKDFYAVKYTPEFSSDPLKNHHIVFDENKVFRFYNGNGNCNINLDEFPYLQDFIDNIIDLKCTKEEIDELDIVKIYNFYIRDLKVLGRVKHV